MPGTRTRPSSSQSWEHDLAVVDRLMRALSRETEPQSMVRMYGQAVDEMFPVDRFLSLSRRDLAPPYYRITRSSNWPERINPWTERDRLPVLSGGVLGEWCYADRPLVLQDFMVDETDQHAQLLHGVRSALVLCNYDNGDAINTTALLWEQPGAIDESNVPFMHWQGNLFGRATHNLVLRRELAEAYGKLDRELEVVGEIQRSLLPTELPEIPTLALAAHYRTSQRAGGDYYDLFPLPDSRWGLFIADVSGHGTPAAVMMAVTHAIAHWPPPPPESPESAYSPAAMMARLNKTLHDSYTRGNGTFVTAFYGVFDAATREMVYSSAGHNPPRLRRGGRVSGLTEAASLPLGILPSGEEGGAVYGEARVKLEPGDLLLLYTDGIVEAMDGQNRLFSMPRLDRVLEESRDGAHGAIEAVNRAVEAFADGRPPNDDRTILAAQVR